MRGGFTLIEVMVAIALLLLVGAVLTALLVRSEAAARSSEAAEAAILFARTMALQAQNTPPDWLPQTEGTSVTLTRAQIASILNGMPEKTFTSPDLYEVRVTRNSTTPQGLANLTIEVCIRIATGPVCVTVDLFLAASSAQVLLPQKSPIPPPSGRGVPLLPATGPNEGQARVPLAGQTCIRFDLYSQEVLPDAITFTEESADGLYTRAGRPKGERATQSDTLLAFDGAGQGTARYLKPCTHVLVPENANSGGYVYALTSTAAFASVTAGGLATHSITHTRLGKTVKVAVSGSLAGMTPDAALALPNGSPSTVNQVGGTTFRGMSGGTYRLTARDVTVNGITYWPALSRTSGALTSGGNPSFWVTYQTPNGIPSATTRGFLVNRGGNVSAVEASGCAGRPAQSPELSLQPGRRMVDAQPSLGPHRG